MNKTHFLLAGYMGGGALALITARFAAASETGNLFRNSFTTLFRWTRQRVAAILPHMGRTIIVGAVAFSPGSVNAADVVPVGGGECEVELDVPAGYPNDGTRPSNVPSGLDWDSDGVCVYVWGPCDKLEELYGDTVDGHNPAPPEDGDGNDDPNDGDDPDDTPDDDDEPDIDPAMEPRCETVTGSYYIKVVTQFRL
ncbi:MAG: hypothetical protein M2R45_02772 [Verrucomicrobia subdivision 3 bacterium]|nr:hypothetical protein [Limisphaerales bacterium]MCS1414321.1 hypothetical protein [Limisphaerales bacterium]